MNLFEQLVASSSWSSLLVPALLSACCGAIVGLERELREKPAGLKTNTLICLGAAMYVYLGELLMVRGGGDLTRIPGQVITGMGFIGAGAIMREGGSILGLTTVATLWTVTAIGLFVGSGHFALAVALTAITVGILILLRIIETLIVGKCNRQRGQIVFYDEAGKMRAHLIDILRSYTPSRTYYDLVPCENSILLTFEYCSRHQTHRQVLMDLWHVPEVKEVRYPT